MTEHDRAERALARALRQRAEEVDFAPLDPEALRGLGQPQLKPSTDETQALDPENSSPRRKRGPWFGVLAAAVALVLVIPFGATFVSMMFRAQSSAPASLPAVPEANYEQDAAGPAPMAGNEAGVVSAGGSASLIDGWRWESMLDAQVQVPGGWGYGFAPGTDWCAEPGYERPDTPFVQRNPLSQATRSILCTESMPDELRQTHLSWRHVQRDDLDGLVEVGSGDWFRVSRIVGAAFITVEVPADDVELAELILGTAVLSEAGGGGSPGCLPYSPEGAPGAGAIADLTTVSEVTVCQYSGEKRPNLVGTSTLVGEPAQGVLDAVLEAPIAPGPLTPTCGDQGDWLLLRFDEGLREVRLDTSGCGVFALDDGVTLRTPSRATCGDLLVGPLWLATPNGESDACEPVR